MKSSSATSEEGIIFANPSIATSEEGTVLVNDGTVLVNRLSATSEEGIVFANPLSATSEEGTVFINRLNATLEEGIVFANRSMSISFVEMSCNMTMSIEFSMSPTETETTTSTTMTPLSDDTTSAAPTSVWWAVLVSSGILFLTFLVYYCGKDRLIQKNRCRHYYLVKRARNRRFRTTKEWIKSLQLKKSRQPDADQVLLQLFVRFEKTFGVSISQLATVLELKRIIYARTGIPIADQVLTSGRRCMINQMNLSDYNLFNQATLHLSLRLLGGVSPSKRQKVEVIELLDDSDDDDVIELDSKLKTKRPKKRKRTKLDTLSSSTNTMLDSSSLANTTLGSLSRSFGKDISNNQSTPASETENSMQKKSMPSKTIKIGKRLSKVVTADHDDLSITSPTDSVSQDSRPASKKMKKRRLRAVKVSLDNDPQSVCEKTTVNDEELAVSFYQLFINKVIINQC